MGLTSWAGERVRKADVTVVKNYLRSDEISDLNLLTTRFLDFADDRARRRQSILTAEWIERTDGLRALTDIEKRQDDPDAG